MDPSQSSYSTWEQRVHDIAYKNGITVKKWAEFRPQSPILRQELFVMATKLDVWRNTTGGCATYSISNTPKETPHVEVPLVVPPSPPIDTIPLEPQKPGTFALLHEDINEITLTYIIKNG